MQSICRYELCEIAAEIIGREMDTPDFLRSNPENVEYKNSRYLYVYFCHVHLDAPFPIIRKTLWSVYKYPKTVYQVFGRAYKRNKQQEQRFLIQVFKQEMEKQLQGRQVREHGQQIKLDYGTR